MKFKIGKVSVFHILRRVSQFATFLLMPGLFVLVFADIRLIYTSILNGSFDIIALFPQVLLVAGILLLTAIFGRFFCGFICAFGSMNDFFWFISQKIFKRKIKISYKTDRLLKYLKYIIILFIVVFIWTFELITISNTVDPWNIFGMYASFTSWPAVNYLISVGGLLLLLIIIGAMFIERFFCRYLCPLGAIFVPLSRFRIFAIKKPRSKCNGCSLCTKKCEMGIPLYLDDTVKSGECINCLTCQENCPKENITTSLAPTVVAAAAVITIAGLYYVGNIVDISGGSESIPPSTLIDDSINEQGKYQDGVYTGSAPGYKGITEIQVTVEKGNISEIEIISTDDDMPWFDRVEVPIISSILAQQTPDVETITGATYSSYAIINAVADALVINGDNEIIVIDEQDYIEDDSDTVTGDGTGDGSRDGTGKNSNQ